MDPSDGKKQNDGSVAKGAVDNTGAGIDDVTDSVTGTKTSDSTPQNASPDGSKNTSDNISKTDKITHGKPTPEKRGLRERLLRARQLWGRGALGMAVFCPLFFMAAALGTKWGMWDLRTGFGTLTRTIGPRLLMATMAVGVLSLIWAFLIRPRRGFFTAFIVMFIPLSGLLYAGYMRGKVAKLPFIHDVSTDTQKPPLFTETLMNIRTQTPGVNGADYLGKTAPPNDELVSVLQVRAYPDIRPIILSDSPDITYGRAKSIIQDMGWKLHTDKPETGILEATETTFWYGFKDDVIIRIKPAQGGGSIVDIRSLSRIGGSDIGANANRIRRFTKRLNR